MLPVRCISLLASLAKDTALRLLGRLVLDALPMVLHLVLVDRESLAGLAVFEPLV